MQKPIRLQRTREGFDLIAKFYDQLVFISSATLLQRAKTYYIAEILHAKSILILGGGTGVFLEMLLKSGYQGQIVYLELSGNMLLKAKKRIFMPGNHAQVLFIHGSIDDLPDTIQYDCVVSNFYLDIFLPHSLQLQFEKIKTLIKDQTIWYFTDFINQSQSKLDWRNMILKPLYIFFRCLCKIEANALPDYDFYFHKYNWVLQQRKDWMRHFISSRIYRYKANI